MVQGEDGKWRSMANEKLYESKMLIGAIYRSELARGLSRLGYGIEKTHADGRFEIAGVSREVIDAFSTRRAEIEAGMAERGMGSPSDNPRLAERAALMSRAAKRDIDRGELAGVWQRQAADLGFDAVSLAAEAAAKGAEAPGVEREAGRDARARPRRSRALKRRGAGARGWRLRPDLRSAIAGRRGRGLGRRAPLGARGGVLQDRSARRRARLEPRRGDGRRGRGRGGADGEGRIAACGEASRHGRAAHDGHGARQREGDHRADGGRPGTRRDADARPRRRQGAAGRSADRGPEGRRQADRRLARPRGGRPGLCRQRQDHHAEPRPGASGEARLRGARSRALGVGRAHAGVRGRNRKRDPAALPRALRGGSRPGG